MRSVILQAIGGATIVLIVTLACFHKLVLQPTAVLVGPQRAGSNDLTSYFIPVHSFPRQCWQQFGQRPFWNPFRHGGVPHLGNPQSAMFYPPNWLCWWFDASHVLSWSLAFHHLFGGFGTFLLCRRYSFGALASMIGATVFAAAPYLVAHSGEGHYAQICAVAWMPWALLAFESLSNATRWSFVGVSLALAFGYFAGHCQEIFYLGIILTVWVILDAGIALRSGQKSVSIGLLARWGAAAVVTACLVAVDLIPAITYLNQTARGSGLSLDVAGKIAMNGINLFQLLNPFALGGPDSYAGTDKFFWESLCCFGTAPLLLSVVGAILQWRSYAVRRLACTGVFLFLFGFGAGSPVFAVLVRTLPGLDWFRVPSRVLFFCSLAVAVLTAAAIDTLWRFHSELSDRFRLYFRRSLVAFIVVCIAALGAAKIFAKSTGMQSPANATVGSEAAVNDGPPGGSNIHGPRTAMLRRAIERSLGNTSSMVWMVGSCLLVYLAVWRARAARPALLTLWIVIVSQLLGYSSRLLTTVPAGSLLELGPVKDHVFEVNDRFRTFSPRRFQSDHAAQTSGYFRLQGYDPLPLARTVQFFTALTGKDDPTSVLVGDSSPEPGRIHERLLDLANVRFITQHAHRSTEIPDSFQWRVIPGSTVDGKVDASHSPVLFENTDHLPRAFIVGQTRVSTRAEEIIEALREIRPREEVLMNAEYMPPAERAAYAPASIIEYTPNRVVVETDLPAVGYLVLSDSWYPGWSATDNGRPTSVIPANGAFRAVPLGPGVHRVVFSYRPPGLLVGSLISGIAWAMVVIGSALSRSVRRLKVVPPL